MSSSKAAPVADQQQSDQAFSLSFNNSFNEQFNRDYVKQQQLLESNPRFSRTRQSVEVERRNPIGKNSDLAPYPMYQEDTLKPSTIRRQAFTHSVEENLLNQLFLSVENIEHVQQRIRYEIYKASNGEHIIGKQSEVELVLIMRSIYLTYGKNLPTHLREQIKELNDLVLLEVVPRILSEIQGDLRYLYDASIQPMPLALPQNMSNRGNKTLPSVTSIYNV